MGESWLSHFLDLPYMIKIIKYLVLIVLLIATCLVILVHNRMIWYSWYSAGRAYYLLILPSIILYIALLSRRLTFLENLIHELTHMLFAAITFQKIRGLYVTSTSGVVDILSDRRSTLVTLAPYFFPLLTILLLCFFALVEFQFSRQIVLISYLWYMISTIKHLLKRTGELSSTGVPGYLAVLILNFWISYFILSWCVFIDFNQTLIMFYDGLKYRL